MSDEMDRPFDRGDKLLHCTGCACEVYNCGKTAEGWWCVEAYMMNGAKIVDRASKFESAD